MTQLNSIISVKRSSEELFSTSYLRKMYTSTDTSSATEVAVSMKSAGYFLNINYTAEILTQKKELQGTSQLSMCQRNDGCHKRRWKWSALLSSLTGEMCLLFSEWESKAFS